MRYVVGYITGYASLDWQGLVHLPAIGSVLFCDLPLGSRSNRRSNHHEHGVATAVSRIERLAKAEIYVVSNFDLALC